MAHIQIGEEIIEVDDSVVAPDEVATAENLQAKREYRDTLLKETDWWAVGDRTMTQAEIDYRQALRDVPAQDGFPLDITWPVKPE